MVRLASRTTISSRTRVAASLLLLALTGVIGTSSTEARTHARSAQGTYSNSAIADTALRYVGQWGGEACRDAHRSGLTGSTATYPVEPGRDGSGKVITGQEGDGQCRSFVNCVVWIASGGTQWLGGQPDGTYFGAFTQLGALELKSLDDLQKGDIVQWGNGIHTYVIVKRVSGSTFTVVDSNSDLKETVRSYDRQVALSASQRAFRLGSIAAAPGQPGANVVLKLAPRSAAVLVDGRIKVHDGQPFHLAPGTHRIAASMPGFFTHSIELQVTANWPTVNVPEPMILIPSVPVGEKWLQAHPAEARYRSALAGSSDSAIQDFYQALRQAYRMWRLGLPHIDQFYRVDYGVSRLHPHDPTAVAIFVKYWSAAGKKQAVEWLKFGGYDPSAHEVYFQSAHG